MLLLLLQDGHIENKTLKIERTKEHPKILRLMISIVNWLNWESEKKQLSLSNVFSLIIKLE